MKKLIQIIFIAVAFSSVSNAQLSLKGGVNFANQSFENEAFALNPGTRTGYVIGANFAVNVTQSIALRPGMQFSIKGTKFSFQSTDFSSNFKYVEIPVDLVYNLSGFSIHAGPYFGLLLSAITEGEDVKENFKSADFGVNLGLGYRFGSFGVGGNYGFGLGNLNDISTEGSIKNKVFSLYLTYTL